MLYFPPSDYSLPSFSNLHENLIPEEFQKLIPFSFITPAENNHILLYKKETKLYLYSIESNSLHSLNIGTDFDTTKCSCIVINTNFIMFFVPNTFIGFIDCCNGFDFISSTNKEIVTTNYDKKLITFSQAGFNWVFAPDDVYLLERKIDWMKIAIFLEDSNSIHDWLFIAHILTHNSLIDSLDYVFKRAIELNLPFNMSAFITEYFISSLYQILITNKEGLNSFFMNFIPSRFEYEPNHMKSPSEAKIRSIVEDLVLKQSQREEETLSIIMDNYDKTYSPLGFMSISMTYLLLLLAFDTKVPKQKLPYPISNIYLPTIKFTSISNDAKKLYKDNNLTDFGLDFITKQTSFANMIPNPNDLT